MLKTGNHPAYTKKAWGCWTSGARGGGAARGDRGAETEQLTERRTEDIARQGGEEAADRKGWDGGVPEDTPGSHTGGVGNLPDRLWKPGAEEGVQNSRAPLKFTLTAQTYFKRTMGVGREGQW